MKKIISVIFAFVLAFAVLPLGQAGAELADGKYSLPYQVNKAGSTSASIANDYFIKPATLVKKDGKMYVQVTLKNSNQFKKFESPSGGNKTVSKDAANDRRTQQFNISSLSSKQTVNVRIEIPEENYYHNYKIDFVWFADSAKLIESYAKPAPKPAATTPAPKPAADTAKQEAAKKAEAEAAAKKAAEEKAKAEAAKKAEAEKTKAEAEAAKKAEEEKAKAEAEGNKEETTKDEATKADEEAEKEEVATKTAVASETKATATSATEGETADAGTTDSSDDSKGGATGWIIGIIAVLLVAVGGFFFLRKPKSA